MSVTGWIILEKYLPHIASSFASLIVGSNVVVTSLLMQNMPPIHTTVARFFYSVSMRRTISLEIQK